MNEVVVRDRIVRERECIHRSKNIDGHFYPGSVYVQALQRLPNDKAMLMAKNVGSLFWSDAPKMQVWLCRSCIDELGLR